MSTTIQAGTWSVEPTGSTAAFSVRNMIFKTVQGRFPIESAEVSVDADGVPRSVTATLDAAGFSTDHPKRDRHVRGKDFLHTDAHPHLTFRSTAVVSQEPGTWLVKGRLTLREVTSEVHLTVRAEQNGDDTAEVVATTLLDRRAAGVGYGPSFLVGRKVAVELDLKLHRISEHAA
ncbi:YceI family protein [Streptomyces mirabilis]|uniref:YceI family protein n=1 Tax=Streptomyces mirabilis TaxID=68239 RepID=A0ABU3V537_9ACTN|nr:YceI family protein [Streptomyces mirabilis]MCX5355634.1 YceI family protein [Streptomyces mirabilis]MDU9001280.1 YceI family protein [Streptomyces mirabilis]